MLGRKKGLGHVHGSERGLFLFVVGEVGRVIGGEVNWALNWWVCDEKAWDEWSVVGFVFCGFGGWSDGEFGECEFSVCE